MLRLEEIAEKPELKALIDQFGKGEEGAERYMQTIAKKNEGFIDPISLSPGREEIYGALRNVTLREILGGGTGSDFMSYLIPTKIYQVLLDAFRDTDLSPEIVGLNIPQFEGGTIQVVWGLVDKMRPVWFEEPGGPPVITEAVNRASLSPKPFGMNIGITQSMIEDSQFDIMEYHIRAAGKEMGAFVTRHVISQLWSGYDSSNNAVTGGSGAITVANVLNAIALVEAQGGSADTFIGHSEQKYDLAADTTTLNLALQWKEDVSGKYEMDSFLGLNWFWRRKETTNGLVDSSTSRYFALVFEKDKGAALAWKRPLTISNYDAPRESLKGAVVTARMVANALHDGDFIAGILEAT